ncbi:hypothetical protein B5X24_HaOG214431 [Helicoverpa armigera]|uniref:BED-type domain-containing protein n=1 Tax=Helicoverpa armigera TaxID=29058 RepID=A0A2W1BCI7_HELAM|nr:hypothetical protein B5X24_HaOG214431 [Helicoverpa armigera]
MSQREKNPIWQYFDKSISDTSKAVCKICNKCYSLGNHEAKKQTSHGLKLHLSKFHDQEYSTSTSLEEEETVSLWSRASSRPFGVCRALAAQLGTLAPARRTHAHLLRRTDRLLRELRNLDAQRCRETHKVAVIYVGKGQETRNEILSNRCGSPAYEAFLAALAWEVELESHVGFTGGLRGGGGGGVSAPYLASLTLEALFHVATRMPADSPDAILNKVTTSTSLEEEETVSLWSRASSRPFGVCRALAAQLGTLAPARRTHAHLLRRTDRLLRELRNLDAQRCRETHKVAVIYVGKGQETRNEILSNRCGSPAYEAFLAALAWEVELESHVGFTGGLRGGGGGGVSAPYLASLTLEALFHVATRMPADSPDAILNKTRHLGNDEVHVVWSEHWRPYKRDTLPTQFCDVLIVLYPLPGGLLRCTVSRKPDVCVFGPLWEECIIRVSCVAALVRGAAVAGGRAVRAGMALYQHAYAERSRELDALVRAHTLPSTFETFVERLRDPVPATQPHDQGTGRLAAALLDHGASAWAGSGDTHGVSPRPSKRLGPFKRPPHNAHPAPHTAPPLTAPPPLSAPSSAPRRNR